MKEMKFSKTTIAIPPGETIREKLQDRGMSQKEFAARMDLSQKHVSKLINGEVQLTQDVAQRLEMVLGVPARFWNNLEAIYREDLERVRVENELEADLEVARNFPYNEMMKDGWVPVTRKPTERVLNLRKFFEVVRLDLVMRTGMEQIACRRLSETEKGDYALAAWAQQAKLVAREAEVAPIDIKGLEKALPEIRAMNLLPPQEFSPKLRELLAGYGVALVYLPHYKGSFLHGATFVDGKKILTVPASVTSDHKSYNVYGIDGVVDIRTLRVDEVIFPEGLVMIVGDGFKYSFVSSVTLPSTLEVLGSGVFRGCGALTELKGFEQTKVKTIPSSAFRDCGSLYSLALPAGVTKIDTYAFSGCFSLRFVSIPDSVTSIGEGAFDYDFYDGETLLTSVLSIRGYAPSFPEPPYIVSCLCRSFTIFFRKKKALRITPEDFIGHPSFAACSLSSLQLFNQEVGHPLMRGFRRMPVRRVPG